MSAELASLQRFMAETDPEAEWREAYDLAKEKYDFLKWIAYPVSALICMAGYAICMSLLIYALHPQYGFFAHIAWVGIYDAIGLRVLVGLTPWFPWPPWFREFGDLHDTLIPFDRVLQHKPYKQSL